MEIITEIDLLEVTRGDDFELCLLVDEGFSLAGCTAEAQMRKYASDSVRALLFDVVIDGQYLTMSATAAQMKLAPGNYVYDVEVMTTAGKKVTIVTGKMTIRQE